jgi:hypothetical protein
VVLALVAVVAGSLLFALGAIADGVLRVVAAIGVFGLLGGLTVGLGLSAWDHSRRSREASELAGSQVLQAWAAVAAAAFVAVAAPLALLT